MPKYVIVYVHLIKVLYWTGLDYLEFGLYNNVSPNLITKTNEFTVMYLTSYVYYELWLIYDTKLYEPSR